MTPLPPFPSSPPAIAAGAKSGSATRWLLITTSVLGALFCGLLMLVFIGLVAGPVGLLAGIVLAVLPVPIYMLLALWVDRFEKEPVWMLAAAFLWGATAATLFAAIFNTVFEGIVSSRVGEHAAMATAVIAAPVIEELAKGLALIIFFLWKRDQFDNVLDGIIYATMTGLGFAMTENMLYYGRALAMEGVGASVVVFILRGVISPFAHPLFTSMTGIGLGLARLAPTGSKRKLIAPALGICLAMLLHCLWNLSASFGAMFLVAYALIMVPAFLGLIAVVTISLRKEGQIIREQLRPELSSGILPAPEYHALSTVFGRIGAAWRALGSGGWSRRRLRLRLHDVTSALAFHRWRAARGIFPRDEASAAQENAYVVQLRALAAELGWPPPNLASPPLPFTAPAAPGPLPPPLSPRRSSSGLGIVFGSLGCLGILAAGVFFFAVLVIALQEPTATSTPPTKTDQRVEEQPLSTFLPPAIGDFQREKMVRPDPDMLTLLGAVEGVGAEYSGEMQLLLLKYRSPETAAATVKRLAAILFPEAEGWQASPRRGSINPDQSLRLEQEKTGNAASVWNYGSMVMIFEGDAAHISEFAQPSNIFHPEA